MLIEIRETVDFIHSFIQSILPENFSHHLSSWEAKIFKALELQRHKKLGQSLAPLNSNLQSWKAPVYGL